MDDDPIVPFHLSERKMLRQHDEALLEGVAILKAIKWAIPTALAILTLILTTSVMRG